MRFKKTSANIWESGSYAIERSDGKYVSYHTYSRLEETKTLRQAKKACEYHANPNMRTMIEFVVSG